ncbi:MAG: hypothetical protein DRH37_11490 [Deltaproteobacteria bacterium]|nr:MAG: hypothetical protein DRH37_11490 [Deltaproteobacteria bacterium]
MFEFFQNRPRLTDQSLFRKVLFSHLPDFIRDRTKYRACVKNLPPKIKYAILAGETASTIVYEGGWEQDFEARIRGFVRKKFLRFFRMPAARNNDVPFRVART